MTMSKKTAVQATKEAAEAPRQMEATANATVDQAQAAFDKASDLAHTNIQVFDAAASALKSNATELQLKAMEIAQANTEAWFDLARRLLAASQPAEIVHINQSFVSDRVHAFLRQAEELNAMMLKLASEAARPVQEGVLKSFDELKKAIA